MTKPIKREREIKRITEVDSMKVEADKEMVASKVFSSRETKINSS